MNYTLFQKKKRANDIYKTFSHKLSDYKLN